MLCIIRIRLFCCPCLLLPSASYGICLLHDAITVHLTGPVTNSVLLSSALLDPADMKPEPLCIWPTLRESSHQPEFCAKLM